MKIRSQLPDHIAFAAQQVCDMLSCRIKVCRRLGSRYARWVNRWGAVIRRSFKKNAWTYALYRIKSPKSATWTLHTVANRAFKPEHPV